jgi:hypothetical protein
MWVLLLAANGDMIEKQSAGNSMASVTGGVRKQRPLRNTGGALILIEM